MTHYLVYLHCLGVSFYSNHGRNTMPCCYPFHFIVLRAYAQNLNALCILVKKFHL